MSCPFRDFRGQPGSRDCWSERHANAMRGSSSPRPRESPPVTGAMREPPWRIAYAMRVLRQRHAPQCAGFSLELVELQLARARRHVPGSAGSAQSEVPRRNLSYRARVSATSASTSSSRPSRPIASRFSVARNQV